MSQAAGRPRPRAKRAVDSDGNVSSSTPTSSISQSRQSASPRKFQRTSSALSTSRARDDDDFFVRRKRTVSAGPSVEASTSRVPDSTQLGASSSQSSASSDNDSVDSSGKRRRSKTKLPSWTRKNAKASSATARASQQGIQEVAELSDDSAHSNERASPQKQKGRSPSLTPPPEVAEYMILRAKNMIKNAIYPDADNADREDFWGEQPPTAGQIERLDPDLARLYRGALAEQVRERSRQAESPTVRRTLSSPRREGKTPAQPDAQESAQNEAGPSNGKGKRKGTDAISISSSSDSEIEYQPRAPSTSRPSASAARSAQHPPNRRSTSHQHSPTHSPASSPVLSPSPLPNGSTSLPSQVREGNSTSTSTSTYNGNGNTEIDTSDRKSLTLRGRGGHEVRVMVRPTTKMSVILAHFVKVVGASPAAGLGTKEAKKARLMFEGETLAPDSTVSECDVEDDDIIDVHW